MTSTAEEINWLLKNWDKIPDTFKTNIQGGSYSRSDRTITGVPLEEHTVILLLDRQKPSVEQSYDFDEERIALTRTGKIIWGFDSGCSCPSPFDDSYPNCYTCVNTWKEFEIELDKFDVDALKVVQEQILKIKAAI